MAYTQVHYIKGISSDGVYVLENPISQLYVLLKYFPLPRVFIIRFSLFSSGYFLLHYLCEKVGEDNFFQLLRHYIHDLHHGKLVHSTDFLALYFEKYPLPNKSSNESIQETCLNWLDTDILPAWIGEKYQSIGKKQVHEKNTGF